MKGKRSIPTESILTGATKQSIEVAYQQTLNAFSLTIKNIFAFLKNTHGNLEPYTEALKFSSFVLLI